MCSGRWWARSVGFELQDGGRAWRVHCWNERVVAISEVVQFSCMMFSRIQFHTFVLMYVYCFSLVVMTSSFFLQISGFKLLKSQSRIFILNFQNDQQYRIYN